MYSLWKGQRKKQWSCKEAARHVPFVLHKKISKMVGIGDGIISTSAASPVIIVKKKDGSLRLCVNYG